MLFQNNEMAAIRSLTVITINAYGLLLLSNKRATGPPPRPLTVFTHVASIYANFLEQKKAFA